MPATAAQVPRFAALRAGLLPYRQALALQEQLLAGRGRVAHDTLLLVEHPAVITLGRGADATHLCWSPAQLRTAGIDCLSSQRGGDVTLHSPGQLVGYPIVDLNRLGRDLHGYLRRLERLLIASLARFGIVAGTVSGRTGVWVGERKIASIGIAVRQWVSWHGFALNIANDLQLFRAIVPCGLPGVAMTSMSRELDQQITVEQVLPVIVEQFAAEMDALPVDEVVTSLPPYTPELPI
ncbi:MAG: lipoyl(octanoyl) transferase LipB [Desulfuromonadales bacterium]|nr:lipoyl(octanoyl) transferase LipB [Desulfuromonadales bacterium]